MSENDTSAAMSDDQPHSHVAEYPFNDADPELADVILVTSDAIKFYVNKTLLSLASSIFRTMFTLPSPQTASEGTDDRPCIPVQDESKDLFQLLSWCDSRGLPSESMTLEGFQAVLRLADKYGMESIIKRVANRIELCADLIKKESIKIYAIAIRYQSPNLVKLAARSSLALSVEEIPNIDDFIHISAKSLQNLYTYHFECRRAAKDSLRPNDRVWSNQPASDWPEVQPFRSRCPDCPTRWFDNS